MMRAIFSCTVIALCIGISAAVYFWYTPQAGAAFDASASLPAQVAYWRASIEKQGAKKSYDNFALAVEPLSYGERHVKAHAFGAGLFAAVGADGIGTCDARFSFGCFHQFLGDAIASLGLESIPSLNEKCFETLSESPLSCQHGIGHGALASIGYDSAALLKALEICRDLPGADPIGGCYGGVFMEFNERTMLGEDATPREYDEKPFAPCDTLEGDFVPACIYWQPQWWMSVVPGTSEINAKFAQMGDYCREFGKTPLESPRPLTGQAPVLLRACFEGIGNIVIQSSGFDPIKARNLCIAAGNTAHERLLCRAIGANHFGIDVSAQAAAEVCADLYGTEKEFCDAYAANRGNVANELPLSL